MANVVTFGVLIVLILVTGGCALSFGAVGAVLGYAGGIAVICVGARLIENFGPALAPRRSIASRRPNPR